MLITELKSKETIASLVDGKKVFMINCQGCKEVHFPEKESMELRKELAADGKLTGFITTDYICNPENMKLRLEKHMSEIQEADAVLVLSCGVGVQTVAEYLEDKPVYAACDTYPLPGFQGVTPLEYKCDQCGECSLNLTGVLSLPAPRALSMDSAVAARMENVKWTAKWNAAGNAFTDVWHRSDAWMC